MAQGLGLEEKVAPPLDAVSLSSSLDSGMRTPQCRICFQGPEQVSAGPRPTCGVRLCDPAPRGEPPEGCVLLQGAPYLLFSVLACHPHLQMCLCAVAKSL